MWVDVALFLAWLAALVARMESADRERNEASRASIERIMRSDTFPTSSALKRIADRPVAKEKIVVAVHRKAKRPSRTMTKRPGPRFAQRGAVVNPEMGMRVIE